MQKYYSTGTVSVANGATAVTGVGTAWQSTIAADDEFRRAGHTVRVAAVIDDTHLTLAETWPGTSLVGSAYEIAITFDGPEFQLSVRELLEALGGTGNLVSLGALVLAANLGLYASGADTLATFPLPALARQFLASSGLSGSLIVNAALKPSVAASALTIELKQADAATNCDATNPALIGFRSATLTSGAIVERTVTGALSIVVPSTATLGQSNGAAANIYVYALDNAGTVELAVAGKDFGDGFRDSTTVMNTASDDANTLYSTTARSNVAFRKLGVLVNTQATAGTWATAPSEVKPARSRELETEFFKTLKAAAAASNARTTLALGSGDTPTFTGLTLTSLLDLSGASAGQIKFPASPNLSSNANTLDAYIEGTFTPSYSSTGSTFSYNLQTGYYTRVGRLIFYIIRIILNTSGNTLSTNAVFIAGLPSTIAVGYPTGMVNWQGSTSSYVQLGTSAVPATTTLLLQGITAAGTQNVSQPTAAQALHATGGTIIDVSGFYTV